MFITCIVYTCLENTFVIDHLIMFIFYNQVSFFLDWYKVRYFLLKVTRTSHDKSDIVRDTEYAIIDVKDGINATLPRVCTFLRLYRV